MRYAAGLFSRLIERIPVLKQAAYILVLNIGVQIMIEEFFHIEIPVWLRFTISIGIMLGTVAYAYLKIVRTILYPILILIWISQGLALVNAIVAWLLKPPKAALDMIWALFRQRSNKAPTITP